VTQKLEPQADSSGSFRVDGFFSSEGGILGVVLGGSMGVWGTFEGVSSFWKEVDGWLDCDRCPDDVRSGESSAAVVATMLERVRPENDDLV